AASPGASSGRRAERAKRTTAMPRSHGNTNPPASITSATSTNPKKGGARHGQQQLCGHRIAAVPSQTLRGRIVLNAAALVGNEIVAGPHSGARRDRISIRLEVDVVRIEVVRAAS